MRKTLRAAGIQMAPVVDVDRNISKAKGLIELAAKEGARVIALPQLFNARFFPATIDKAGFSLAEGADGRTISEMREAAARTGTCVIAPIFEKDGDGHYNTAFVLNPDGSIAGKYRKLHVPAIPLWEEKSYFKAGDLGFPVFDTPFGRIGAQICWDSFFPEGFRILALKGAEAVFVPTAAAFYHSHKKWERALLASAHSNGLFIFRVNRVGVEEKQEFYGESFCAGPDGELIGSPSGRGEGVVLVDMDLGRIADARGEWAFLKDRRPDEYAAICKGDRQ